MQITAYFNGNKIEVVKDEKYLSAVIPETCEDGFLEFCLEREQWNREEYVLLPASAYNGNRFECLNKAYPPMFSHEEAKVEMPVTITASPARLNKDGTGRIAVTSGDVAVPCIGIFDRVNEKAALVFTTQQVKGKNVGYAYEDGVIAVSVPRDRRKATPGMSHKDKGLTFEAGEKVILPCCLIEESCKDLPGFFKLFSENRKCMGLDDTYTKERGTEEIFRIQEEKFNKKNYEEYLGAYMVGIAHDYDGLDCQKFQVWQPGWVGGGMTSYPLMKCGSEESYEKGIKTLDFLFSTQKESGFFPGIVGLHGEEAGDAFDVKDADDWHLLRKSADVLLFLFKHFAVIKEKEGTVPERFLTGTRKLADAFVKLWERYGQFGQFVSHDSGDIIVGGSTSAGIASAGLAKAYEWFGDEIYMEVAKAAGEYHYQKFLEDGCTTGGPGEILQCPDSESAFGLLESMVTLCEMTGEDKWVDYAKTVADYCSTWGVAYNYQFPQDSEFGRLDIKTVGSVFANAQNKHSGPGICTLSGDSLCRLYKITGEEKYLELIRDIANNVFQYISRNDRPISAKMDSHTRKPMPAGYVNERVNMSDWEGEDRIGEIFYGSTWAETSALLTWAELRDIL